MDLRDYQGEAVRETLRALSVPTCRPLIVAPTGSGKSVIIAELCRRVITAKPHYTILVLSHRKEIISQNSRAITEITGKVCGVYSAGLGIKTIRQVTCANIQSIYKKDLKPNLIIIDEAHLISGKADSMYGKLLDRMLDARIVGCTATPYRMDCGNLIGGFFTDVSYDISIAKLLHDGYLAPIYSTPRQSVDLTGVRITAGDYNLGDLEAKYSVDELVESHANDIKEKTKDRHHILVFCTGVDHTKKIAAALGGEYVTGEMLPMQRDQILNRFKTGQFKYLVNCDILTTGFDFPGIDCIALLRATKSTALYVQIVGRGMRIAPWKTGCLLLDYGDNIDTHGPIDCIQLKRKTGEKLELDILPTQECQACGAVVHANFLKCPVCGGVLKLRPTKLLSAKASKASVIAGPEEWKVTDRSFRIHKKADGPPMLWMRFYSGIRNEVSEFFCFEHEGFASQMAASKWIRWGGKSPVPKTTEQAFNRANELYTPARIEVVKRGKYYAIVKLLEIAKEKEDIFPGLNI